jgi:hypothetical protein
VPRLKPDQARGFSFQSLIRFERLETIGGNSANIVFRSDDGHPLGMHLLRSDLIGLYTDLADWIKKELIAKTSLYLSTDLLRAISLLVRPSQGLTAQGAS